MSLSHSLSSRCWSPSWWPWWNRSGREDTHRTPPASCLRSQWAHAADEALEWHSWSGHWHGYKYYGQIKRQMDNCPKVTPSAVALAAHGGGSLEICGAELSPYWWRNQEVIANRDAATQLGLKTTKLAQRVEWIQGIWTVISLHCWVVKSIVPSS